MIRITRQSINSCLTNHVVWDLHLWQVRRRQTNSVYSILNQCFYCSTTTRQPTLICWLNNQSDPLDIVSHHITSSRSRLSLLEHKLPAYILALAIDSLLGDNFEAHVHVNGLQFCEIFVDFSFYFKPFSLSFLLQRRKIHFSLVLKFSFPFINQSRGTILH